MTDNIRGISHAQRTNIKGGIGRHTFAQTGCNRGRTHHRMRCQRVVLVRDRSLSMADHNRAVDASTATGDLLNELAVPCNQGAFEVAVIDFSGRAAVVHNFSPASGLASGLVPIHPTGEFGGTDIGTGIALAHSLLKKAELHNDPETIYVNPVVIIFTDGEHNSGPPPHAVATQLKSEADLVAASFGSKEITLLREIATSEQHAYHCTDGKQLCLFLSTVGATLSNTLATGGTARRTLAALPMPVQ